MDQLTEFFQKLFDTSDWPARWYCGEWSDFHGWLYIFSDVMIWLAYFFIPMIIIWFIQRKPNVPFLPVFWLFGVFIISCGATHLLDAVIFWWPAYRLSGLLKFITAVVSMLTVFALIRDMPKIMDLKFNNKEDLLNEIENKDALIDKLRREIEAKEDNY
jgi:hypothetical protein